MVNNQQTTPCRKKKLHLNDEDSTTLHLLFQKKTLHLNGALYIIIIHYYRVVLAVSPQSSAYPIIIIHYRVAHWPNNLATNLSDDGGIKSE